MCGNVQLPGLGNGELVCFLDIGIARIRIRPWSYDEEKFASVTWFA